MLEKLESLYEVHHCAFFSSKLAAAHSISALRLTAGPACSACAGPMDLELAHCSYSKMMLVEVEVVVLELA